MVLSYEDLQAGEIREIGSHTFSREEIVRFAEQFDPQPFHLSEAGGEASPFGALIASGWHTCSVMMGLFVRRILANSTSMGSPGIDEIRWIKPVRVGDTLTMRAHLLGKRVLVSKPDRGIIDMRWEGLNQLGETVVTAHVKGLFGLRDPETETPQQ